MCYLQSNFRGTEAPPGSRSMTGIVNVRLRSICLHPAIPHHGQSLFMRIFKHTTFATTWIRFDILLLSSSYSSYPFLTLNNIVSKTLTVYLEVTVH